MNPGQDAEVKVETFPFTKYGTIHGKHHPRLVRRDPGREAGADLLHPGEACQRATIQVENKTVHLSPGMAVTVEVKTGKRRVIEYFLSPLMQYTDESLRER